jgi:hypothetical protein
MAIKKITEIQRHEAMSDSKHIMTSVGNWGTNAGTYFEILSVIQAVLRTRDVYPGSRISDPDFYPCRIPDQKTATKERVEKNFFVIPFFVATNFTKLKIILFVKSCRK